MSSSSLHQGPPNGQSLTVLSNVHAEEINRREATCRVVCINCNQMDPPPGDSAASASCHGRVPATSTPRSNANSSLGHEDWLASPALFELELPEALSLPGASFLPHDDLDDPSLASADAWLGCDAFLDPMLPDTLDLAEPFLLDSLDPFAGCSPLSDAPMPSSVSSEMSCTFSSSLSLRSRQPALEAPVQPKARVPAYRQKTGRPRRYDTSVAQTQDSEGEVRIWRERRRGAPQRHAYSTQQEGLAKRRDRNRNTALSTYYKRKEKTAQLEAEADCLQPDPTAGDEARCGAQRDALEKENAALREILQTIESSLQDGPLQPGALNAHTAQ